MAIFGGTSGTLVDILKAKDSLFNGSQKKNINACTIINEPLNDITWKECSDGDYEEAEITTRLGKALPRGYNQGIKLTKGDKARVLYPTTMIEALSQIDIDLDKKNPTQRKNNDDRIFQGINNDFMSSLIYDNHKLNPQQIMGIFSFLNSLKHDRVIDAGGTADASTGLTSCLVSCWGDSTASCIFPENKVPGLQVTDKGEKDIYEVDDLGKMTGSKYFGKETHFKQDYGFANYDDRFMVRICNIPVPIDGKVPVDKGKFNVNWIIAALNKIPNRNAGKMSVWMNTFLKTQVDIAAANMPNLLHTVENQFGQLVSLLYGVPIRITNSMKIDETKVA